MNFQQADTWDILEASRWDAYNEVFDKFTQWEDGEIELGDLPEDLQLMAHPAQSPEENTGDYLTQMEALTLEDVEEFAGENNLISSEKELSERFYGSCPDIVDNGTETDINCYFNDFMDGEQKSGNIHQIQANNYEFDHSVKSY